MLLIRRLWLLPATLIAALVYFLFLHNSDSPSTFNPFASLPNNDGKLHWKKLKEKYPVKDWIMPIRGSHRPIPSIQYDFHVHPEAHEDKKKREARRDAVKAEFEHAWAGYKAHAWTKDEVAPVSGAWRSSFGGWGATLVDSLDTLVIMDMETEFNEALKVVADIDFTTNDEEVLNVFETTIRYIGGLLGAYDLTDRKHKVLLKKARELGEVLYTAFDTPNRMPTTRWEWRKSAMGARVEAGSSTLLAELGSLSIEFLRLTQLSGDPKYYDAAARIGNELEKLQKNTTVPGLWPTIINAKELKADYNHFTMGGMADSTYEYLPKLYTLMGGRNTQSGYMYDRAIMAAKRYMFFRPMLPKNRDVLVSGNVVIKDGKPVLDPEGQHLTCFLGGMVALGAKLFKEAGDLDVAKRLVDGCIWAYDAMPSGLMPETFHMVPCHVGVGRADEGECTWNEEKWLSAVAERAGSDPESQEMTTVERGRYMAEKKGLEPGFTEYGDTRYILRPEAIEGIFMLYRITGDPDLQEHAWRMFQSIIKATRTDVAHAAVVDVRLKEPTKSDRMESFWTAETLKYFYLMFSEPKLVSLDSWVL